MRRFSDCRRRSMIVFHAQTWKSKRKQGALR
jgi:hypothetical protein